MNIKSLFTPEVLAEESEKLFWSALPAILIGYGFHNTKIGIGFLLIMFFITSAGQKIDKIYEITIKK